MKKSRGVSKTTAKSKLGLFVTNVNGWKVVPDMSLKGTLLIIRVSSSKSYIKSYQRKKLP